MLNKLLDSIKCTKTYLRKSEMCSGNAYRITLTHRDEKCRFIFHDNFKNASTKRDFLYALMSDAYAFDRTRDVYEFARAYGYTHEEMSVARKIYHKCEEQSIRLHRLFNAREIEILSEIE